MLEADLDQQTTETLESPPRQLGKFRILDLSKVNMQCE
jgi:hypothetical protein